MTRQLAVDGENRYLLPIHDDPDRVVVDRLRDGRWEFDNAQTRKVELALTIEPASKVTG